MDLKLRALTVDEVVNATESPDEPSHLGEKNNIFQGETLAECARHVRFSLLGQKNLGIQENGIMGSSP